MNNFINYFSDTPPPSSLRLKVKNIVQLVNFNMDIYECFRSFNDLKDSIPLCYNLEDKRASRSKRQRIAFWIASLVHFSSSLILIYSAYVTVQNDRRAIANVLGLIVFIDNYGPIIAHAGLFIVTARRPVAVLILISRIDELLSSRYSIPIDYKRRQKVFCQHVLFFEGCLLFLMVFFLLDYIASKVEWHNCVVMTYFIQMWVLLILQLVLYSTINFIIRDKVLVIKRNIDSISQDDTMKLAMLLKASIGSANLIGNGLVCLFVTLSTFYITLDIYVVYRFQEERTGTFTPSALPSSCCCSSF